MFQSRDRNNVNRNRVGLRARLQVESLESRSLFSATAGALPVPAFAATGQQAFITIAFNSARDVTPSFSTTAGSERVISFAAISADVSYSPATYGRLSLPADTERDASNALINHFAPGEGTGAPFAGAFDHGRPGDSEMAGYADSNKLVWTHDAHESFGGEMAEHGMPMQAGHMQMMGAGDRYAQFEEIVIVGPQMPAGVTTQYAYARADVSPADAPQQRVAAREARSEVTSGRSADQAITLAPSSVAQAAPAVVRDGATARNVLQPTIVDARALMQTAMHVAEVARVTQTVFATAVVANVDHETGSGIIMPVAMIRAIAPLASAGATEASTAGTVASESAGAIVVAQTLLRFFRSFAGPAADAAADVPTDAGATMPQGQGSWDAPMFMSANLLGLAPGNPWVTAVSASGQRTLRWVAGVSLLITVAGCWYCAATTARARRAALEETLEGTLHLQF